MIESTCPHKWDFRSYGTCQMCLKDMQNRHSPNYISTEMLRRIEHLSYTNDLPSRYVLMMASELLSLRQQIGQRQAELEFIMQKNMQEPKQEPAQAVPVGWHVPPMSRMYFGEYAQIDAEAEAKRVGGTAKAIPLYTHPAPLESKQAVPVAEVLWFDPRLDTIPRREPYKIIDASMAWMDQAEIGTKLYDRPPTRKLTDEEIKLIKGMIEVYEYKALQCDRMSNPLAARQKEKELERVALLRKILGEQE